MKLELKCNFFSNFTRLNFFVTPLGNTKMQSQIKDAKMNPVSAKKSPTLWGMKFFSSSSIFFKIIIFHFLWLLLKSLKCRQWNDKNFKMFTFVSVLCSGATNSSSTSKWTIGCLPRWSCNIRMWHFERKSNTRNQMEKKGKPTYF